MEDHQLVRTAVDTGCHDIPGNDKGVVLSALIQDTLWSETGLKALRVMLQIQVKRARALHNCAAYIF